MDMLEALWMQTDYIVDYDSVSMNGIVHLNNGHNIDIRTKDDMNEITETCRACPFFKAWVKRQDNK